MRPALRASVPARTAAHRVGHPGRVGSARDGACHEHRVAAELHRQRGVRGGADAGVEDHRDRRAFEDQRKVVGVLDSHAASDRRAEWHHGRTADCLESLGEDRIVVCVWQHHEAIVDEFLGGAQELPGVRQERLLVADHLELDPVRLERLAGESGGHHGVARGVAAGGVWQDEVPGLIEHLDQRTGRRRIDTSHGNGNDLRAARTERPFQRVGIAKASRPGDQPRVPATAAEQPFLLGHSSTSLCRGNDLDSLTRFQADGVPHASAE
jgi:hypothetical protein